ncbi:hypothetical protein ABID08_002057 [Rhizobium binae]|uniref:Lipoprotein n=1 Tax=Rhizobium binae TaxID=1138190 RepID=A0ABV2ME01_9HYPH|nr:hypothetical protein [Rhizobium binae]MBX4992886.1 hypothetical protein [Rhizobium binae]NKL52806.1 hypothetical protein [Rhizobium leguminosarum bv. viciae]QSY84173.1 hypothetical protein J2J99_10490 [Rhizobium binae]
MKRTILLVGVGVLSGCVSAEQLDKIYGSQMPPTAAERAAAITYIKSTFYDPYSIRDASISNAVTLLDTGYRSICVRFNAKNRMGGYVGMTSTSLRFRGASVVSSLQDAPGCNTDRLQYSAFPELENL